MLYPRNIRDGYLRIGLRNPNAMDVDIRALDSLFLQSKALFYNGS